MRRAVKTQMNEELRLQLGRVIAQLLLYATMGWKMMNLANSNPEKNGDEIYRGWAKGINRL